MLRRGTFPFVLVLGLDFLSMPEGQGSRAGVFAIGVALIWYAQAQVRWLMHDLGIGAAKALSIFAGAFLFATVAAFVVALLISLDFKSVAPATS